MRRVSSLPLLAVLIVGCHDFQRASSSAAGGQSASISTTESASQSTSSTGCGDTMNEPRNCGFCGHDCLLGECMAGQCQPYQLVTAANVPPSSVGVNSPGRLAVDRDSIYWTDAGANRILSIAKNGKGSAKVLYSPTAPPSDIATDGNAANPASNIYFTTGGDTYSLVLSTLQWKDLGLGTGAPRLVLAGGYVFWPYQDFLVRYRLADGVLDSIAAKTGGGAWGAVHDLASDGTRVYWSDTPAGILYDAALDAAQCTESMCNTIGPAANGLEMIAVDASSVYWAEGTGSRQIWKVSKTTSGSVMTLATLPKAGAAIKTMVSDNVNLYWTDDATNAVHTTRIDASVSCDDVMGTCAALSRQGEGTHPTGIAFDDSAIYWAFSQGPGGTGPGSIWGVAKK